MLARAAVSVLLLGVACGPAGPVKQPPAVGPGSADAPAPAALPLDRDYPRLAEQAVQLHRAIADAFAAAGQDCAAATARLDGLRATYAEVVAANNRIIEEGREKELRPALAKHGDQLDAAARAIVSSPTMASCAQDPAFTRAFDELVGAPAPTSTAPPPAPAAPDRAPGAPSPRAPDTAGPAGPSSSR